MEILNSIILGLIQGLTEFLPISSSGHLIIFREIFGLSLQNSLAYDAILQLATTFAIIFYFRNDFLKAFVKIKNKQLIKQDFNLIKFIIIATIPAIILGLLLEEYMETVFRNGSLVAGTLILGAVIMYFADYVNQKDLAKRSLNWKNSLIIGFFQSLALIPGMSRSGMSISGGLFMKLTREQAVKFSFLIAIPILLGSGAKKILDLYQLNLLNDFGISLIFGIIAAFFSGLWAISFLIKYLKNNSFKYFIIYRIVLAVVILLFI